MRKEKISFISIARHWFVYHPWLKIISLLLAIIVWFYVQGKINTFN